MPDSRLINPIEQEHASKTHVLLIIRSLYILLMAAAVMLAILRGAEGSGTDKTVGWFVQWWWVPLLVALTLGITAISLDTLTPRKKLSSLTSILFGLIAGLLATVAIGFIIDLIVATRDEPQTDALGRIITGIKAAFALTLCYLGVSIVYSTQDEYRLIIPYVEFSKQMRGTRPLILDTSAIIDGRINDMAYTGFISAPLVIPRFVINELQTLSDSSDKLKRNRGRRGLDIVRKMQNNPHLDLAISDISVPGASVDQMLIAFAQEHAAHLVTTDFNLNKVASIHDVKVLNINDLANALKPVAIPGQQMSIEIVKRGEGDTQGVGYLGDGTMVVVDGASESIGEVTTLTVTSSIQTSAGRMIFGEVSKFDGAADNAGNYHNNSNTDEAKWDAYLGVQQTQLPNDNPSEIPQNPPDSLNEQTITEENINTNMSDNDGKQHDAADAADIENKLYNNPARLEKRYPPRNPQNRSKRNPRR